MKNYLDKFNLGTWNVRSLYMAGALTVVVEANLERYGIAIAAIQKVRWTGEGNLKLKKHTIFYSGGQDMSEELCYIQVECKHMNLILINGYAPTEDKQQDEKEAFYEDLNTIFESTAKSQPKIILGDFNAKIGKEDMYRPTIRKESLHTHSNENGNRLINFAISKELRISSTAIEERDKARSLMLTNPNTENNNNFAQKLRETKRIRIKKRLWEKERIKQIEDNRTNPRLFFKQTKELKTGYNPRTEIMKEENGELVTGEKIAKQFGKMFEELLNPQTHQDHTQIKYYTEEPEDVELTDDEVRTTINTLKNNKSPGEDDLAAELLKYSGEELISKVGKLIIDV
ncbi:hypothetical protein QTP88_004260 [Uroleucon formosanum]